MRLEKAKDITKLRKQIITDKNGHRRTVWVKINEDEKKGKRPQQELPPEYYKYAKQIKEGNGLHGLYQYVFPEITDQKVLVKLVEKAVDKGQDLGLLYRFTVPRITDQKVLENLLEKAIDRGAREGIIYLFRILPKIHNQKTLIRFAEKIYAKISDFQKFDNRDVLEELTYYVLPRIEDRKVLEFFLDRIMNEDYFDLEKRLAIINLVFLGLQKNQKVLSELVINQIDELNKFKIKDTYSFEELRSFPVEIKNKILKEYMDFSVKQWRRAGLTTKEEEERFYSYESLDAYLDELYDDYGLEEFKDDYDDYNSMKMIQIIQSNIKDKALRLEQIFDRVVPTITEPDFFSKVVDKIDPFKTIKIFPKSFHEQAIRKIVQERNLQIEDNQEVINQIQDTVQKTFDKANHGKLSNYEIVSVVKYENKNFNKELAIKKNNKLSEPIFHGSPIKYLDSFLENGIIVPNEERTGSMFGRGFYSTPVSSKAMQYLGDGFRETGTYGILFFGEQYLGKLENDKELDKSFDSVKGKKGLVNVEYATTFNEGVNFTHFAIVRT